MAHVLVIDDDRHTREFLRALLEDEGHSVTLACDGADGLERYASHQPDLIVTEIIMPRMDGIAVLRELHHQQSEARVIAISGGGHRLHRDYLPTAEQLGANRTLAKPFLPDDFLGLVREVLAARSGRGSDNGGFKGAR